jgi:hypothetical protein
MYVILFWAMRQRHGQFKIHSGCAQKVNHITQVRDATQFG